MSYNQKTDVDLFATDLNDLSLSEKPQSRRESFFSNLNLGGFFSRGSSVPKLDQGPAFESSWNEGNQFNNTTYRPDELGDGIGEHSLGDPQYVNAQGWSREKVDKFSRQFFNPENPNIDLKSDTRIKLFEVIEKDLQLNGRGHGNSKIFEHFLKKILSTVVGILGIFVAGSKKSAAKGVNKLNIPAGYRPKR